MNKLWGLRKDVWKIVVAIEKLAGIESQNSKKGQFLWPVSEEEETEVQKSSEKGKQREKKIARSKGVEERSSSFSLVAFSVGTRVL